MAMGKERAAWNMDRQGHTGDTGGDPGHPENTCDVVPVNRKQRVMETVKVFGDLFSWEVKPTASS